MTEIIKTERAIRAQQGLTEDLFIRFAKYIDAKQKSIETYRRALRQMFRYFQAQGITHPQREDILSFREHLQQSGHKPATVQGYICAARLFFQWTERENFYPNIAQHIKGAKIDKEHKRDYLTSSQTKAIISDIDRATLQGKRDYALFCLMVTGGLRSIEAQRANVGDIRTVGDFTALFIQGKGRDERTDYIKLSAPVEAAIRDYLKARGENAPEAPLFASTSNNNRGQRMTTRAISGIVKGRMIAAGYNSERLTCHSLRHTAVTLSLLAGKPLEEVQQFARHSNIATTLIYNHALEKAKNGCAEAVANAIF